jgi:CRISPR-associated endonuclease Cas1
VLENIKKAKDVDELRTLEAEGSKYFWNIAASFIPGKYEFTGRKPRKGDVINSAIDFLYAVLYGIVTKSIVVNGLDPFYGCIHTLKSGRISLTYDLSEVFKSIVVHTVIQASRKADLATFKNSRLLKPKSIEVLVKHLYHRLSRESEKICKRKSIWHLPIRETNKFKEALIKRLEYNPYTYDPSD